MASDLGDYPEAQARYRDALAIARQLGRQDCALLEACAELLARLDRCTDATVLLGGGRPPRGPKRAGPGGFEPRPLRRHVVNLPGPPGPGHLASASERGRALAWEQAVGVALEMLA